MGPTGGGISKREIAFAEGKAAIGYIQTTHTHRSDEAVPVHAMKACWGVEARLQPLSKSAREGASGEAATLAALLPKTRSPSPLHTSMKVCGHQEVDLHALEKSEFCCS
jgi:hypothetical protein